MRHGRSVFKGSLAAQELVGQDTQAPEVNLFVVKVFGRARFNHLWREVIEGTAHGLSSAVGGMHTPAKVGNLEFAMDTDQNILGLDVAVNDVLPVQITQGRRHLGNVLGRLPLGEAVFFAQVFIELSLAGKLEDQKDALAIVKVAKELENVGMAQVGLDLNLAAHLLLYAAVLNLALVQHLQGADEARRALAGKVYSTKLTLSQWSSDLKHAQMPLPGRRRRLDHRDGLAFFDGLFGWTGVAGGNWLSLRGCRCVHLSLSGCCL